MIALLGEAEWSRLCLGQQVGLLGQQGCHVVEAFGHCRSAKVVLVEVLMEVAGDGEQAAAVFLAALLGESLEDLYRRTPAFLGCLRKIAVGEFLPGLRQGMLAGLLILLGRHFHIAAGSCRLSSQKRSGKVDGPSVVVFESEQRNRLVWTAWDWHVCAVARRRWMAGPMPRRVRLLPDACFERVDVARCRCCWRRLGCRRMWTVKCSYAEWMVGAGPAGCDDPAGCEGLERRFVGWTPSKCSARSIFKNR